MAGTASALPADDPRKKLLHDLTKPHVESGLRYVTSGHYEGEHWLATFAVYHLTASGLEVTPGH